MCEIYYVQVKIMKNRLVYSDVYQTISKDNKQSFFYHCFSVDLIQLKIFFWKFCFKTALLYISQESANICWKVKMKQNLLFYIQGTTLIFQRAELHPEIFINVEYAFMGDNNAFWLYSWATKLGAISYRHNYLYFSMGKWYTCANNYITQNYAF